MSIQTVFFKATDGVDLKGLLYKSQINTKKLIISVHGMATNCIKRRDEIIATKVNKSNIDLLVFNNRGHDLVNDIYKNIDGKQQRELAGTAYEEISECYFDILGAIDYATKKGYDEIFIMGHSLGCTKTIYTYNKLIEENQDQILQKIKGVLLLSLVDIPTAIKVYLGENFASMLTYAKNMQKEKMENELMPSQSFIHPISIKTFLRYSISNEDIDFARFSDLSYNFEKINKIAVPLFMRWGNNNEMILQKADELCGYLKHKIENEKLNIGYIDGADHSYHQKEDILAEEIVDFLNKEQ